MANLGSLIVSLEANMARFTSDMRRAADQTEQAMGRMDRAVNLAKGAIAALGLVALGQKLAGDVRAVIDYADHMNDLTKSTGLAIEQLDGLALAAKQSGGDLDGIADSISKLSTNMGKAPEKFKALGITAKDPLEAFKQLADIFVKIQDPQLRAAFAAEALGKSWKGAAPLLAEGGKSIGEMVKKGHDLSGLTKEMAEQADKYNDVMAEMEIAQRNLARELAKDLLPGLTAITKAMADGYREGGKLNAVMSGLGEVHKFLYTDDFQSDAVKVENLTKKIEKLKLAQSETSKLEGPVRWMADKIVNPEDRIADLRQAEQDLRLLKSKMAEASKPPAGPSAEDTAATAAAEAAAKRFAQGTADSKALLDGRLKEIENAYAKERDAIAFQSQYAQEQRSQDLISLDEYNASKVKAINDGLAATLTANNKEIAELRKARAAAVEKPERAQLDNQIQDKQNANDKARIEAQQALQMNTLQLSGAQSELNKTMKEWGIQQDAANADLEFANSLYGKSTLEVQQLTAARRAELEIEERIRQAKEKGAISDEAIARYRKDAKDKSGATAKFMAQGAVRQIVDGQRTPAEVEQQNHDDLMRTLLQAKGGELDAIAGGNLAIERENQRHQDAMMFMRMQADMQAVQLAGDSAGQLYGVLQQAGLEQTALGKALFIANKAIAVAEIIMNTEVAAAKALAMGPIIGPPLAMAVRVMGYASAGIVLGTAIASAEGGYDIPAGTNPVTQLHEKEMVLPRSQANVIRDLAANGGGGARGQLTVAPTYHFNIDSRSDRAQVAADMQAVALRANADLVDKLQRAGRI